MRMKTAAIICAFNEKNTIVKLIRDVFETEIFDEVIVVDDGSSDETRWLIKKLQIDLNIRSVHFVTNMGKGFAMARGVEMAQAEIIVFIDADLSNFKREHAIQLINPISSGEADMVLGQPSGTLIHHSINPFKNLTGQRALRRMHILPILQRMKPSRFGVETLLNMHYNAHHLKVQHVILRGLMHPTKFAKTKPNQAMKEFVLELHQIVKTTMNNSELLTKSLMNRYQSNLVFKKQ